MLFAPQRCKDLCAQPALPPSFIGSPIYIFLPDSPPIKTPVQPSLLRNHQHAPVLGLLAIFSKHRSAVDLSDCGTGKTYVAAAVSAELKEPTLVICPKITQTQWRDAAAHFGETVSIVGYEKLRTGRTPYGTWDRLPDDTDRDYFKCQCCQLKVDFKDYQPCHCHPAGIHCIVRKKKSWNYGKFNFHPAVKMIIFDEIQRCSGIGSLNEEMLVAARRQNKRILGLSATVAHSPLHMKALGYALDLFPHPSRFAEWARRYSVRYAPEFYGLHWFASEERQLAILAEIRASIVPSRGVRVTTAEIPGFPEVDIVSELYDLEEAEQVAKIQAEMLSALAALEKRTAADSETALTVQLRAHQRVELLKVPLAVELAKDYAAQGVSVGIFVNFRQTMEELRRLLDCNCFIDGSPDGVKWRERSIQRFQTHQSRLILINSNAGGVGLSLPDLSGVNPRGGLVFPGYSAEKLKQVFGRFPRDSSKSKSFYRVLLAAKTGDVKIHRALRAKLNNLDALNDADLMPDNLSFSGG